MFKKNSECNINTSQIEVVHYLRRPFIGNFSVERLHADIRKNIDDRLTIHTRENRFFSKGIFRRLIDAVLAIRFQSDVNHVTGDVHYLTYFLRRKNTILTILDCVPLETYSGVKFYLFWFFWYWLPEKSVSKIVVISESTKRQVIRYLDCDPNKIKIIHCNVSQEFEFDVKSFDEECPRILHIGTGDNKNLERHVAALSQVPCTLVIIGELTRKQSNMLGKSDVKYQNLFNLSRAEILYEYICCDLLLFASVYEGFGLPIVEAQTIGRPVITSNLWSMPEVAGRGALLVDPYSVESIRSGVMEIIGSPGVRAELIELGLENSKRFTAKAIGTEYSKLYLEVHNKASKRVG